MMLALEAGIRSPVGSSARRGDLPQRESCEPRLAQREEGKPGRTLLPARRQPTSLFYGPPACSWTRATRAPPPRPCALHFTSPSCKGREGCQLGPKWPAEAPARRGSADNAEPPCRDHGASGRNPSLPTGSQIPAAWALHVPHSDPSSPAPPPQRALVAHRSAFRAGMTSFGRKHQRQGRGLGAIGVSSCAGSGGGRSDAPLMKRTAAPRPPEPFTFQRTGYPPPPPNYA
ncbi:uncharacterized protein LOC124589501 [Schistocerca americana]|uniref:uncharacterized protein LOC124589501 n=1 Tax=Schistocerca americana TaxID=7009 RepID=UPI001F502C9F|nr:uncharacterized protein LOC124589501 [Schistocerca americana]